MATRGREGGREEGWERGERADGKKGVSNGDRNDYFATFVFREDQGREGSAKGGEGTEGVELELRRVTACLYYPASKGTPKLSRIFADLAEIRFARRDVSVAGAELQNSVARKFMTRDSSQEIPRKRTSSCP